MVRSMKLDVPYYSYNNSAYFSRESVFESMLMNNDIHSNVEFKFADKVFDKVDWSKDINVSISTLYKMRAKQLRDKYNYLILAFSGGSDSSQMLNTFLNNNIFIDEIQVVHHEKLVSKLDENIIIPNGKMNALLEYKYAVKPMLDRVTKESPRTKITTLDASDFSLNQFTAGSLATMFGEKDLPSAANHRVYSIMPMVYQYYMNRHNMLSGTHNSALIRGFEKPILIFDIIDKNKLMFCFSDMSIYSHIDTYTQHFAIEDFYWSADAPFIPVKQSHLIKHELENNRAFYERFYSSKIKIREHTDPNSYSPAFMIERELSRIIYPDFNPSVFAGSKPTRTAPELVLIEKFGNKTNTQEIISEYGEFKLRKYKHIKNQTQIRELLYTKPYVIGNLKFNWRNS
jgi:hypothetical protein